MTPKLPCNVPKQQRKQWPVEYCVQVWCPYQVNDIKMIEKIQKRATKLVHSLRNMPYLERLKVLKLYPLEIRQIRGDFIEVFKIMNGLVEIRPEDVFFILHNTGTRVHSFKLFKKQLKKGLKLRKYFFLRKGWLMHGISFLITWLISRTTNQFKNIGKSMDMGTKRLSIQQAR